METLLSMAISLILASQSPNIPYSLRIEALNTAKIALDYAQNQHTITVMEDAPQTVPNAPEIGFDGKPSDPSRYDNQPVVRENDTPKTEVFW